MTLAPFHGLQDEWKLFQRSAKLRRGLESNKPTSETEKKHLVEVEEAIRLGAVRILDCNYLAIRINDMTERIGRKSELFGTEL